VKLTLVRHATLVLEVQLRESNSDCELLALVEHGELDLRLCMLPLQEGPFDAVELLLDP